MTQAFPSESARPFVGVLHSVSAALGGHPTRSILAAMQHAA
jgi:hypothetical protein